MNLVEQCHAWSANGVRSKGNPLDRRAAMEIPTSSGLKNGREAKANGLYEWSA